MFLEIVTPEAILFSSDVTSVAVPGIDGEFQLLNNHAPIISILGEGTIKIKADSQVRVIEGFEKRFFETDDGRIGVNIKSGTIEVKNNRAIILAD